MADLTSLQRSALEALLLHRDHPDAALIPSRNTPLSFVRRRIGCETYTARQTRDLMHRLRQAGLVEGAILNTADAIRYWRITAAGLRALELGGISHG